LFEKFEDGKSCQKLSSWEVVSGVGRREKGMRRRESSSLYTVPSSAAERLCPLATNF
jgi:hypothetical protein